MKRHITVAVSLAFLTFTACKKSTHQDDKNIKAGILPNGATLPGIIDTQVELIANGTYYLNGKTYVKPGGELKINAGVTVKAIYKYTAAEASALIITRGGVINADGTNGAIVFTSNNATPAVGDWGGIVILGKAPVNKVEPLIGGIDYPTLPLGVDARFGGSNASDNSGVLKYVRIEWAGTAISADNELNSLTLGGVGSGTTLDHIQVSYGRDDAFQFFGGTVNASYLISLNTTDDILDFELGYQGNIQYVIGISRPGFVFSDANGIESDNDASSSSDIPRTQPNISNITLIGRETFPFTGTLNTARFRRATGFNVTNSIFIGYGNGITLENGASGTFSGNVLHVFNTLGPVPPGNETYINAAAANNDVQLIDPFAVGPSFDPSPALPQHFGKGAVVNYDYWYLGWTAGL